MRVAATAPRGKFSIRDRVKTMKLTATDAEEEEDFAILLRCLMREGGPFAIIEAAKKFLEVPPGDLPPTGESS